MSIYDEFAADLGGDDTPVDRWESFANVGDAVRGVLLEAFKAPDKFNGTDDLALKVQAPDGEIVAFRAKNVDLRRKVVAERPQPGDKIVVVHTGLGDAQPGKNPPKLYEVAVQRSQAPEATPAAAPAQQSAPAASASELLDF